MSLPPETLPQKHIYLLAEVGSPAAHPIRYHDLYYSFLSAFLYGFPGFVQPWKYKWGLLICKCFIWTGAESCRDKKPGLEEMYYGDKSENMRW